VALGMLQRHRLDGRARSVAERELVKEWLTSERGEVTTDSSS
jgi:hypothetical protein